MQIYAEHYIDNEWYMGNTAFCQTNLHSAVIDALFKDWQSELSSLNERRVKDGIDPFVGLPYFKKRVVLHDILTNQSYEIFIDHPQFIE